MRRIPAALIAAAALAACRPAASRRPTPSPPARRCGPSPPRTTSTRARSPPTTACRPTAGGPRLDDHGPDGRRGPASVNAAAAGSCRRTRRPRTPRRHGDPELGRPPRGAPSAMGGYTVRSGDTLSGLAAVAGVPAEAIAAINGLDPDGVLVAGTVLKLPTGAPAPPAPPSPPRRPSSRPPARSRPRPASTRAPSPPSPRSTASPARSPPPIAYQESGFNNSMVSSANARGVMQVMPGTWTWIQDNLASRSSTPPRRPTTSPPARCTSSTC